MKKTANFKYTLILLSIALLAGSCTLWSPRQTETVSPPQTQPNDAVSSPKVFSYSGIEGVDALTLLKELYPVQTRDFGPGLGEFVESIDGIKPEKDQFWAFYVNGKSSTVGASQYVMKNGDLIEWKLEKIE